MEFRILGPVTVRRDGVEVPLDGSKQCTVLAALLLAEGRILSDAQLSRLLWGDQPPATSCAQIYTYISRLRKRLGGDVRLIRQRPGYLLRIGSATFDYAEFQRRCRLGHLDIKSQHWATAAQHFRQALHLWQGPALANVTEFLAGTELPSLDETRMEAIEGRIEADLASGRHGQLIAELTALVAEYPLQERLRAQLMTALYRVDRQADAFTVFLEGRRVLAEELGVDPGAALHAAYQGILSGDLAWQPPASATTVSTGGAWTHTIPAMLPPDVADFTGCEEILDNLALPLRLADARPGQRTRVLITGMAGVGKTAMAVHAAHAARPAFTDGELYADLRAPDGSPRQPFEILGEFLRALGFADHIIPEGLGERIQLYRSQLAGRRILVLLDDAENDAQVRPLLPGGVDCRVLITSRTRLPALDGIHAVSLDPLTPTEAVHLLAQVVGAHRVYAEFPAADRIVRACGHLPLAIRVAGGRLAGRPRWPLERMASRLENRHRVLDELRLSDLDVRTSLARSYRSLGRYSRAALRGLALLEVPSFPDWALAAILGSSDSTSEEVLEALLEVRLLETAEVAPTGHHRYTFHPLVRPFALERGVAEDDEEQRTRMVERALTAWLERARVADRVLARHPLAMALGTVPDDGDPTDDPWLIGDPWLWFEEERDALLELFGQACRSGHHATAWELAQALSNFLFLREIQADWLQSRLAGGPKAEETVSLAATLGC